MSMSIIHTLQPATLLSPSLSSPHTCSSFPLQSSFKPPILSRRLFLPSVSGIWDALTGGNNNNNTNEAVLAIRRGMSLFRQGDVLGSAVEFDRAIQLDPRQKAYLWQRGLSLYYLDRFEDGADQFRLDVAQNPNDTEESIWCFLCEAQLYGVDEAKKRYLEVGIDSRPVMRETYNMFKDSGDPEKLVAAFSNSRESDYFYASLYAGLFYESRNESDAAKVHIVAACKSSYGQRSNDYMASLSKLSKLIAQKGHKISFISTPRNIKRLPPLPPSLQPFFNFVQLPFPHVDKLPENAEATTDIPTDIVPYLKKAFDGLQQPLMQFLETSAPDCIIYDFAPYWLPPITSKLGILSIHFCTFTALSMSSGIDFLVRAGQSDVKDKIINTLYFEPNESGVSDLFRAKETIFGADFIAIRSCKEIEGSKSLEKMENQCKKKVIPVGLLPPSLEFGEDKNDENGDTILKWLDKHEKRSVVYVAFGSEVILSDDEFNEIAKGLESSSIPFLWIVKNHETECGSNENGLIWNKWAPQLRILAHESIGGFLTHCGWSSVIEGLQFGCPLIMLPFQNEQGLVARIMEEKMVGVKVERNDEKFNRDSVAKALRLVMVEDEGKGYRSNAKEMSKIVGDKELHQKYIDDFVDYVVLHIPASKH